MEVLTELMALRAEDNRQTPTLHITPRVVRPRGPSTTAAIAGSAGMGNQGSPTNTGAMSTQQQDDYDGPTQPSFYIDNSCGLGDPDMIVVNSLSGCEWNVDDLGGSSVGGSSRGAMPMVQRVRPSVMPPIAEQEDGYDHQHQHQHHQHGKQQQEPEMEKEQQQREQQGSPKGGGDHLPTGSSPKKQ